MIRLLDGLDVCDRYGAGLKYNPVTPNAQAAPITGRDGQGAAFWMFNAGTGPGVYAVSFSNNMEPWIWSADVAWYNEGTGTVIQAAMEFWQAGTFHTGGVVCSMVIQLDGHVRFQLGTGFSAVALAISSNVFPVSSAAQGQPPAWGKLEVKVGSGSFEVRYEGHVIMAGSNPSLTNIDTFVFQISTASQNWAIDNIYILDSAPGLASYLYPCRIDTLLMHSLYGGAIWSVTGSGSLVTAVSEAGPSGHYPDGDATYIQAPGPSSLQEYSTLRPTCYGLIYAVAINMCAAPGLAVISAQVRPQVELFQIGNNITLNDSGSTLEPFYPPMFGYRTYQAIAELNPFNNVPWNDGAIANSGWGVRSESGTPKVTQYYLEKLVSLNNQIPFGCGGTGNYAW